MQNLMVEYRKVWSFLLVCLSCMMLKVNIALRRAHSKSLCCHHLLVDFDIPFSSGRNSLSNSLQIAELCR